MDVRTQEPRSVLDHDVLLWFWISQIFFHQCAYLFQCVLSRGDVLENFGVGMIVNDARVDVAKDLVFVLVKLLAYGILAGEERQVDIDEKLFALEKLIDQCGIERVDPFARRRRVVVVRFAL